ncbi:MAG: hypothetical protein AAFO69_18650 [Bacteroidota bacterium]
MFFFKKKKLPNYMIFMYRVTKFKWIANELKTVNTNELTILLYFFEQTMEDMKKLLSAAEVDFQVSSGGAMLSKGVHLMDARVFKGSTLPKADRIMVLEVHPMKSINDIPLLASQDSKGANMIYYSGIDEAVMETAGGERIQQLMARMGMDGDQPIAHSMISKSVDRAVMKIEEETVQHQDVKSSQADWLSANQR